MAALLQNFVIDLETDMQEIVQAAYGLLTSQLWYPKVTKVRTTDARQEILYWMLDTFVLRSEGPEGGNKHFEDLISQQTTLTHEHVGGGIVLKNDQLNDQDGRGLDQAANWSRQAAAYMAYWPQKKTAFFMQNAHLSATAGGFTGYDGVTFFSTAHPVNPGLAAAGNFSNLHTGGATAASGNTPMDPGACPIDVSVSLDVALQNLSKMFSYLLSIKTANGVDSRFLMVDKIFCGPLMYPRVKQLLSAEFLAQTAASGAGSGDVRGVIASLGYTEVVLCPELAGFESDTTYFIGAKSLLSDPFGAIIYLQREPFSINWYTGMTDVELMRRNELEYHVNGRNAIQPGHPYLLHKCKGV